MKATITTTRAIIPAADCGHDHSHAVLPLAQTLVGLLFVMNSFVVDVVQRCFRTRPTRGRPASAMIGAIILGYPIVWTAIHGFAARPSDDQ